MNGGLVPLLLLSATIGLMLAFVANRQAMIALLGFGIAAIVAFAVPIHFASNTVFAGLWLSMIAGVVLVYLPVARWSVLALPICLNAGFWLGAGAGLSGDRLALLIGIFASFILFPARLLARGRLNIALKVVASWMIAIASLSLFVTLIPTPGYKPDHME
ncbi:MAG: hypothetical protein M3R03_10905 [Pseudomonadota bacterium]|nr:hypothetical protein [Pseudomonadota bacterium]